MRTPSITELRILESAVRTGSFSAAGRELGITQQAVSSRVRELERLLEFDLVLRSPAGVTATEAAQSLLRNIAEVLDAATRLDLQISELRHEASGRVLRIGASQTVSAHLLPGWLHELRLAHEQDGSPVEEVELRTDNSARIIDLVRSAKLDLGFIETPKLPSGLGHTAVATDRMIVAVDPAHPWAQLSSVPLDELARTRLVIREVGSGTREGFERAVRDKLGAAPPRPLVALGTEAAVRSAVARGVGPAVLSELTVRDDVRLGRLCAVPVEPPITRPFSAIWRGTRRDLLGPCRRLVAIAAHAG